MRRVPCGLSVIMGLRSAGGLKREQLRHATIGTRPEGVFFWLFFLAGHERTFGGQRRRT